MHTRARRSPADAAPLSRPHVRAVRCRARRRRRGTTVELDIAMRARRRRRSSCARAATRSIAGAGTPRCRSSCVELPGAATRDADRFGRSTLDDALVEVERRRADDGQLVVVGDRAVGRAVRRVLQPRPDAARDDRAAPRAGSRQDPGLAARPHAQPRRRAPRRALRRTRSRSLRSIASAQLPLRRRSALARGGRGRRHAEHIALVRRSRASRRCAAPRWRFPLVEPSARTRSDRCAAARQRAWADTRAASARRPRRSPADPVVLTADLPLGSRRAIAARAARSRSSSTSSRASRRRAARRATTRCSARRRDLLAAIHREPPAIVLARLEGRRARHARDRRASPSDAVRARSRRRGAQPVRAARARPPLVLSVDAPAVVRGARSTAIRGSPPRTSRARSCSRYRLLDVDALAAIARSRARSHRRSR